jgi:hypothetical protein
MALIDGDGSIADVHLEADLAPNVFGHGVVAGLDPSLDAGEIHLGYHHGLVVSFTGQKLSDHSPTANSTRGGSRRQIHPTGRRIHFVASWDDVQEALTKVALAAKSIPSSSEAFKAASWYFRTGWILGYMSAIARLQPGADQVMLAAGEAIAPKHGFRSRDDLINEADFDTLAQFHWDVAERVREESA